jgi:hypothetical protein
LVYIYCSYAILRQDGFPIERKGDHDMRASGVVFVTLLLAVSPIVAWYTFTFTEAKGANELSGQDASTGFSSSDSTGCTQGKLADHSLQALDEGTIRIEQRTRVVDYAKDSRGYCTTEGTKVAAKGKACSRLQVITARRWEE